MCLIYCWSCKDTGSVYTWGGQLTCSCVEECPTCHEVDTLKHREVCTLDNFVSYFDIID